MKIADPDLLPIGDSGMPPVFSTKTEVVAFGGALQARFRFSGQAGKVAFDHMMDFNIILSSKR